MESHLPSKVIKSEILLFDPVICVNNDGATKVFLIEMYPESISDWTDNCVFVN